MSTTVDDTPAVAQPPTVERRGGARVSPATSSAGSTDIRGGELGILPIIVGIIVIAIYFQSRN